MYRKVITNALVIAMGIIATIVPSDKKIASDSVESVTNEGIVEEVIDLEQDIDNVVIDEGIVIPGENTAEKAFGIFYNVVTNDEKGDYTKLAENMGNSAIIDNILYVYVTEDVDFLDKLTTELVTKGVNVIDIDSDIPMGNEDVPTICIRKVELTYDEICAQQAEMWEIRNSSINDVWADKINSMAADPINNCVRVFTSQLDVEEVAAINANFEGYSYILDDETETAVFEEETTNLHPGEAISLGTSGLSVGFPVKYGDRIGILTTIHSASIPSGNFELNNTIIGPMMYTVYDGCADFGFVYRANPSVYLSHTTVTTPTFTLSSSEITGALPANYTVFFAGRNSNYIRTGHVLYWNCSISSGNQWLICDYSSSAGDSGGCVFASVGGNLSPIAVHNGTATSGKYSTKFSTIKQYGNFTLY